MADTYQHSEINTHSHQPVAYQSSPYNIMTHLAVPIIQKKSREEEKLQLKPAYPPNNNALNDISERNNSAIYPEINHTGIPDQLKDSIENLSGFSMNDVKVHYNSAKPARLNALAYAQGTDIHIAPGQERHLPHEAWHVMQQKQGRGGATLQAKGVAINNDKGLEKEADLMGVKVLESNRPTTDFKPFIPTTKITIASNVLQGAFMINGVALLDGTLNTWLDDYTSGHPELGAVVRGWAADTHHTDNYASDLKALEAAQNAATETITNSNTIIGHSIDTSNPPNTIAWDMHPVWSAWYFNGLEYQDNKTGGWHSNRLTLLPGDATADGVPTRYVEFRRPGAIGKKEVNKMERCIFDLLSGRCWPNAHYDGGYVEITGIPGSIKNRLLNIALKSTGIMQRAEEMTDEEKGEAGAGLKKIEWLINKLRS